MTEAKDTALYQSFGEHLEDLRGMIIRIIIAVALIGIGVFCLKDLTFSIIFAPSKQDFATFRLVESILTFFGIDSPETVGIFQSNFINTDLSAQFMMHIYVSMAVAVLLASPYILYELFKFIAPALYENEKKYSSLAVIMIYFLFVVGVLVSYFIVFPVSFRFLASYQVEPSVVNTITLKSYITTFTTLTFMMGVVFQLPLIVFFLGKMGLVDYESLRRYRKYAFVIILIISAIITPPDLFTLLITAVPLYALFELSLWVLKFQRRVNNESNN